MNFEIIESQLDEKQYFVVSFNKGFVKSFKQSAINFRGFFISYDTLNLGQKLYGHSKKESILIQKRNCRKILKLYKLLSRLYREVRKQKLENYNTIYVEKLSVKKNNNDFLLQSLLNLKFNCGNDGKLEKIISFSCDFLSKENFLNNMCDFKDNKCIDCRRRNIDRSIGCCQTNCKFTHTGVCEVKNISCKLYMCDYLESIGYYFSSQHLPILKKYLTPVHRFMCICMLFKPMSYQVKFLKLTNFFTIIIGLFNFTFCNLEFYLIIFENYLKLNINKIGRDYDFYNR